MVEMITKTGVVNRLKQVSTDANIEFLLGFISKILPKMIHRRNHLRHYRYCIADFCEQFDAISIAIDYSENLPIPVKYEPQSLHWSHEQVTIHSGPASHTGSQIVIESDNCSSQYKSSCHFSGMQELANEYQTNLMRVYGIAEHGTGEVDHVGGVAKSNVHKQVATESIFTNATDIVDFLKIKFEKHENPNYIIKEIARSNVQLRRDDAMRKVFGPIDGSSSWQVIIFKPDSTCFHAAERLCLCKLCREDFGSCPVFKLYTLNVNILKGNVLRSEVAEDNDGLEISKEFVLPGSVCAIAASEK